MTDSVPPPGYVPTPASTIAHTAPAAAAPAGATNRRARPRFARPRILAVAGVALAGAAAALGFGLLGSFGSASLDPIANAAALSSRTPGYRMNLNLSVTTPGLSAPITAFGNGVVDLRDHAVSLSIGFDLSQIPQATQQLGASSLRIGMVVTGGAMYMQLPRPIVQQLPSFGARPWVKVDLTKLAGLPGLSSLSSNPAMNDPSRMLDYLRATSEGVTEDGQQAVDGIPTKHYRATLDPSRLADALPASERAVMQPALDKFAQATSGQSIPIDVWIDAAHLVRRMEMSIGLHGATGAEAEETMVVNFTDYGPQAEPSPPPADQVQDLTGLVGRSS